MANEVMVAERLPALKSSLAKRSDEFKASLPSHISFDKFQRTAVTAALKNPQLLECDRQSFLMACSLAATDGLLPDGREGALVPFKTRVKTGQGRNDWGDKWIVNWMPMAYGLRKKILQSGEIVSLEVGVIYRSELLRGDFIYEIGMDPPIRHRPSFELTEEEFQDSEIVGAYSIARIKNEGGGDPYWSVEVLRRFQIDKIRQQSQTGAVGRTVQFGSDKGNVIAPKGPWVDWFPAMAMKSALRQHSKVLPMSSDLVEYIQRDEKAENAAGDVVGALLETEERITPVLPGAEELDQIEDGSRIDPQTGEILAKDPQTGMTQVDQETAEALDRSEDPAQDQRKAAEEPVREPPVEDGGAPIEDQGGDDSSAPVWLEAVEKMKLEVLNAVTASQLDATEKEFLNRLAQGLPDDVRQEIDQLITKSRRELRNAAKGA